MQWVDVIYVNGYIRAYKSVAAGIYAPNLNIEWNSFAWGAKLRYFEIYQTHIFHEKVLSLKVKYIQL